MRRTGATAWYEANPEGLVGRLRDLARSRPEAARALAARLERGGLGALVGAPGRPEGPRALCPACEGRGGSDRSLALVRLPQTSGPRWTVLTATGKD